MIAKYQLLPLLTPCSTQIACAFKYVYELLPNRRVMGLRLHLEKGNATSKCKMGIAAVTTGLGWMQWKQKEQHISIISMGFVISRNGKKVRRERTKKKNSAQFPVRLIHIFLFHKHNMHYMYYMFFNIKSMFINYKSIKHNVFFMFYSSTIY